MDRVDSNGAVLVMPQPAAPETPPGYFDDGDIATERNGTVVPAWWLNSVQEEILAVIAEAGLTPNRAQLGQLKEAIASLIASGASPAMSKANEAYDLATQGKSLAEGAQASADGAQGMADAAQTAADEAQDAADSAQGTASDALGLAKNALGRYEPLTCEPDAILDANDFYQEAQKFYVVAPAESVVNFPEDLSVPLYFEVLTNGDAQTVTSVCQKTWDAEDSRIHTRFATVNLSEPDNPLVTWGPWNTVSVPRLLKASGIVDDPAGQPAGKYLTLTFDTGEEDETVYISIDSLVDAYTSGNSAIEVTSDNKISLKVDPASPLSVGPNGLTIGSAIEILRGRTMLTNYVANTPITVPQYAMGANKLEIYINNTLQEMGANEQYVELTETSIALNDDYANDLLSWKIIRG
jgi:hypothetical protein